MRELIINALKAEHINTYLVNEVEIQSTEMFFVKKTLDMTRTSDTKEYSVTVYNDAEQEGEKLRGGSDCIIYNGMSEEEIRAALKSAYFAAGFARNPYYEIVTGTKEDMVYSKSGIAKAEPAQAARLMAEALFENDNSKDCFINSAELFVVKKITKIYNSQGVDYSYDSYEVNGEFVVQCVEPADVELYEAFDYDELDTKALAALVAEKLSVVADRAKATAAPKAGEYSVILSGKDVASLLEIYTSRADASQIYSQYSSYSVGTRLQGEAVKGEKLNLLLKSSVPYNAAGIKMKDCELVKEGVLERIKGGLRFAQYLGIEPTGSFDKKVLLNGSMAFEDMKKGERILHVVSFSDFSCDSFSGHFAGEIRLAYLYENGNVSYVTGGSINGNLFEVHDNLVFTNEKYADAHYEGPYAVLLNKVQIAGA